MRRQLVFVTVMAMGAGVAAAGDLYFNRIGLDQMQPAPLGGDLPVVIKEVLRDLIPDLRRLNGPLLGKVEGLAIFDDGTAWVSTDNDAVDDHSGGTLFFSIGSVE